MRRWHPRSWTAVAGALLVLILMVVVWRANAPASRVLVAQQVSPGPLSASHALLSTTCDACHTTLMGVEAAKCISCHATNTDLLQRQPTAFHASIGTCSECHAEHRGDSVRPVAMDHRTLAEVGLTALRRDRDNPSARRLLSWMRDRESAAQSDPAHPRVLRTELVLECATCHSTKDRHQKLFGTDCAGCHATSSWSIPEFRHPSARSVDCVQCHQAPPSHYMMHFQMVSQTVARVPDARVDQCFRCHQTTSWNDIRGVGWYKHH